MIIDLSSNNHPNTRPITWDKVKSAGATAAIIKATQGTTYVNPWYEKDYNGAVSVGIPAIAYHFADFKTAKAEANHFLSVAGLRARVLDSETNPDATWQNEFLSTLQGTNNEVMDYGSASTLPSGSIRGLLWKAAWGSNRPTAACWQFTDNGHITGILTPVDESQWLGTQEQFDVLFGVVIGINITTPPVVNPTPQPQPTPQPSPQPQPLTYKKVTVPTIQLGSSGEPVEIIQKWCNRLYNSGLVIDQDFGPKTKLAVMHAQNAQRISVDGIVGKQTWGCVD